MNDMSGTFRRFADISVQLSVELGRTQMPLGEVQSLGEGSVVPLDKLTDELLDLTANGFAIAKCEVVTQDGRFALRIVSLADESGTASAGASAPAPAASPAAPAAQNGAPEQPAAPQGGAQ